MENGIEQNLVMFDSIDQLEAKTLKITLKIHCARGLPLGNAVQQLKHTVKKIEHGNSVPCLEVLHQRRKLIMLIK